MAWTARLEHFKKSPSLAEGLTLLAGIVYSIQLWIYAHTQASVLDEGAYLVKGYHFVTGRYVPFQDYGPLTNHMPLSFLIPGYVQALFGPGLRSGRYFAVFLGVLMIIGVWLLIRRIGSRWWAAAALWILALSVQLIKVYSIMASQGLVACMFVWVLVLTLGDDRKMWQLLLGSFLAGLVFLTRINMSPLLPFLILYIFWQYGWKKGLWNLLAGALVVGVGHAIFWPNILKLWAFWLPTDLMPFLEPWSRPEATPNWDPDISFDDRLKSLFQSVRMHYFAVAGALVSWTLWPRRKQWITSWRFRAAVFVSALFAFLMGLHMWASLFNNYCVYCLNVYMAFFSISGLLLVVLVSSSWAQIEPRLKKFWPPVLVFGLSTGISYSLIPVWGSKLISNRSISELMRREVPRLKSFRIQPGTTPLWSLFANKLGWQEQEVFEYAIDGIRIFSFVLIGLLVGWLILRYGSKLWLTLERAFGSRQISPTAGTLVSFLILGTLITFVVGLTPYDRDCGWDVIASYDAGGAHLAEYIPEGSKVYWWGGLSAVPLLYAPEAEIFPAQLNNGYSFHLSGDPDELERFGWWSQELAEQWVQEADVILIEARQYGGFATRIAEGGNFDEVSPTLPMVPCRKNSPIHIFVRDK
jgi:hypothetical protein